jgi:Eisosome protein 1
LPPAATAALYVTKGKSKPSHPLLDEDGKLSSAGMGLVATQWYCANANRLGGAATSLKYAKPQDLPSFPSPGLQIASAGAAASLADTNKKTVELWKPGSIPAAEKAAYLAKDYEIDPLWHPELSAAGSKAAVLASDKGANVSIWKPHESEEGQSAAGQAVRKKPPPPIDHRAIPADASRKALMAATGAMASSRRRADSAPTAPIKSPPGTPSSAQWALKAATQSQRGHRSGLSTEISDPAINAARIQNIAQSNVSRQMYTSHPPVSIEVEEKNRQDTIRASAVAMAQKMYAIQQKAIEEAKADMSRADSRYAARNVHNRRTSDTSSIGGPQESLTSPMYGSNLQEAAQRLAQERLAKLRDEHEEYKKYYGQPSPVRSRLSMSGRLRRRASSDGAIDEMDEEQSRKIRSQMSIFQNNLAAVDEKKRQKDREALLAAAQRNVKASMHSMDEEVFQETGKSSPAQREEWATKAREKAQADSAIRMENYGKVHIGGGKYMDQADVDAVAKSRIQPTLDDINEKAEVLRAKEAEARIDQEEQKRRAELEKKRTADTKVEQRKARGMKPHACNAWVYANIVAEEEKREEKTKKAEEKRAHKEEMALLKEKERVEREELKTKAKLEKEELKERNRQEEEEARKFKEKGKAIATIDDGGGGNTAAIVIPTEQPPSSQHPIAGPSAARRSSDSSESLNDSSGDERPTTGKSADGDAIASPASPSKGSKVKSWLSVRFRRSSKAPKDGDDEEGKKSGFIGGANLTGANTGGDAGEDKARDNSMREVAMAGRSPTTHDKVTIPVTDSPVSPVDDKQADQLRDEGSISSISSSDEEGSTKKKKPRRGRLGFKGRFLGKTNTKSSNDTENDEFEEARDTFEEEKLAPPPKLTATVASKASGSPVRDSRFSENL